MHVFTSKERTAEEDRKCTYAMLQKCLCNLVGCLCVDVVLFFL